MTASQKVVFQLTGSSTLPLFVLPTAKSKAVNLMGDHYLRVVVLASSHMYNAREVGGELAVSHFVQSCVRRLSIMRSSLHRRFRTKLAYVWLSFSLSSSVTSQGRNRMADVYAALPDKAVGLSSPIIVRSPILKVLPSVSPHMAALRPTISFGWRSLV